MNNTHDLYLRAHTVQLQEQPKNSQSYFEQLSKWPDYVLVFDCESRLSAEQELTFGSWRFCELRGDAYICVDEGFFHADDLSVHEYDELRNFVQTRTPETADDGTQRLHLYSRSKFVHEVLGMAIQAKAMLVGQNLGFDLSRLALDWGTADNGGWSLVLSQWRNPTTNEVGANKFFPRIVINAVNSKTAIIHSTRAPISEPKDGTKRSKLWPVARFLDLRTLLWALHSEAYSLQSACAAFNVPHEYDELRSFVQTHTPKNAEDGTQRLHLYSRSKFVHEVLAFINADVLIGAQLAESPRSERQLLLRRQPRLTIKRLTRPIFCTKWIVSVTPC